MIRVLLVDDHPVVRSGYQRLLEQDGHIRVVAEAADTAAGYRAFLQHQPEVTVTDLALPGSGGLELVRRIVAREPASRVLVFSMYDAAPLVRRALDAGACGFVTKSASPDSLVAAVHGAHAGRRYLSPDLPARLLDGGLDEEARGIASLNGREFEVFRLLAAGHAPAECAGLLNVSVKTIANNQTRVKEKLGVRTLAELVHLAQRNGIALAQPGERATGFSNS